MEPVRHPRTIASRTIARITLAIALLTTTLLAGTAARASSEERLQRTRIESADAQGLADELTSAGFDVLEGSITARSLDLVVTAGELDALRARGFSPELIDIGHPLASQTTVVPAGYQTLAQINQALNDAAAAYPSICRLVDLTTTLGVPATFEGRHMYALKISDNPDLDEDEPSFLLVACHHAREINAPVVALQAIQKLTTLYGSNPTVTSLIDGYEIWIAPVWNPDGYNYVFTSDNYWRKNRRPVGTGVYGVDQNRNYPQGWSAACGGSTSPSSDTYRGPSVASEAETQTMIAWSESRRFDKVLDFHSYGRDILYGYSCWTHPFDPWFQSEATTLANTVGYAGSIRRPSAEGEEEEWQWAINGSHAILVEIGTDFQPPYTSAITEAGMNWPGILWMLQRPIPVWGHVTDAGTGAPVDATISYSGVVMPHGETNSSGGAFGRYRAFLPPGTYDITFTASGYQTQVIPSVSVTTTSSQQIDVAMISTATSVAGAGSGAAATSDSRDALFPARGFEHPVLAYRLAGAGTMSLDIYDVRGAHVATVAHGFASPGEHAETWAAVDGAGHPLPSGIYMARLTTARGTLVDKVVVAR